MIGSMSKENREVLLEKARQSLDEKRKWAEENLRMQYADETHWEGLARECGVKLTQEQKIELLVEAVLRLYGNLSILPPRDAEIVEMLNKILEEGEK